MNYCLTKEYVEDIVLLLYDYWCKDEYKGVINNSLLIIPHHDSEDEVYVYSVAYNDGYDLWIIDIEDIDAFIIKDGKILEQYIETKKGPQGYNNYYKVWIPGKGEATVHRLVCYTFRQWDKWDSNLVVDHIDRNKWNNCHNNLRLVSQSVNMLNRDFTKKV